MGGKDSLVQHEIDARARRQGGKLFEEFQGLEEEVAGAIAPGALELRVVRSKVLFCIVPRRTDKGLYVGYPPDGIDLRDEHQAGQP
jgi:hypothetical protein